MRESSTVRLEVYDVLGNRVTTLVNAVVQPSGNHAIIWDGRNESGVELASGTYFFKFSADRVEHTGRMVLAR